MKNTSEQQLKISLTNILEDHHMSKCKFCLAKVMGSAESLGFFLMGEAVPNAAHPVMMKCCFCRVTLLMEVEHAVFMYCVGVCIMYCGHV